MIVGIIKRFAIEYEIVEYNLGFIRLWLNNHSIGNWECTYLKPVITSLKRIFDYSSFKELDVNKYNVNEIFNFILTNEEQLDYSLLGFGESFDSFDIRAYLYKNKVVFIWKFNRLIQDNITLPMQELPVMYAAVIEIEYYYNILNEVEKKLIISQNA